MVILETNIIFLNMLRDILKSNKTANYSVTSEVINGIFYYSFWNNGNFMVKIKGFDSAKEYAEQISGIKTKATAQTLQLPGGWTPETRNGVATGAIGITSQYGGLPAAVGGVFSGAISSIIGQTEEWIKIPNWENHTVKKGDTYEFIIDITQFLWQINLLPWQYATQLKLIANYNANQDKAFIATTAYYLSIQNDKNLGNIGKKIQVDNNASWVDHKNGKLHLIFTVIENFWQLAVIGAIIIGLFLATRPIIEEVRLLVRGYPAKTAVGEALQSGTWLLVAGAILVFVLGKYVLAK